MPSDLTLKTVWPPHRGTGGINQLYLGAGVRPFKNFTVGFNASYLFGNTFNDVYAVGSTSSLFEQVMEVRDFHFQFGMQYTLNLSRKNDLTLGVTYSPGKTLLGKTYVLKYDTSQDSKPDTVASTSLRNKFSIADTGAWASTTNGTNSSGPKSTSPTELGQSQIHRNRRLFVDQI